MRYPTFSRQSGTDTADERTAAGNATPVREPTGARPPGGSSVAEPTDATTYRWDAADRNVRDRNVPADEPTVPQPATGTPYGMPPAPGPTVPGPVPGTGRAPVEHEERTPEYPEDRTPVMAGPKPRASFLATLGLILGVVSAMLVLSGPLLGYGIGVAVLALILSLSGIHATGRRHVAGKTDALIGMFLSLAAIVVGVLALTGSLSWLGTDMHPVQSVRDWLDANVVNRFGR